MPEEQEPSGWNGDTRKTIFRYLRAQHKMEKKVVPAMTGDTIAELKDAGRYRFIDRLQERCRQ